MFPVDAFRIYKVPSVTDILVSAGGHGILPKGSPDAVVVKIELFRTWGTVVYGGGVPPRNLRMNSQSIFPMGPYNTPDQAGNFPT